MSHICSPPASDRHGHINRSFGRLLDARCRIGHPENEADFLHKIVRQKRLPNNRKLGASLHIDDLVRVAGHQEDLHFRINSPNRIGQVDATHFSRQDNIGQHQTNVLLQSPERLKPGGPILGNRESKSCLCDRNAAQAEDDRLIIYAEDEILLHRFKCSQSGSIFRVLLLTQAVGPQGNPDPARSSLRPPQADDARLVQLTCALQPCTRPDPLQSDADGRAVMECCRIANIWPVSTETELRQTPDA